MQTTPHREEVMQTPRCFVIQQFMKRDQCISFRAESRRVLKAKIEIQLSLLSFAVIPLLAGNLACPAADALGNVD